jgi:hypothetical protein
MTVFNKSYISSLELVPASNVKELDVDDNKNIVQRDVDRQTTTLIINPKGRSFYVSDIPSIKHIFIRGNNGVKIMLKNLPALEYVELASDEDNSVSIVYDKTISNREESVKRIKSSENSLGSGLFVNGIMDEFFVMWGGEKDVTREKDANNAVTRDSLLLPEDILNGTVTASQFEAKGGVWKYDETTSFITEPEIVYESKELSGTQIDSAFIGTDLTRFDASQLYADVVVVDYGQARPNPKTRPTRQDGRLLYNESGSVLTVDVRSFYCRNSPSLATITKIIMSPDTNSLYVYDMPLLEEIVGNDKSTSRIDVGNTPKLKKISKCSIDYVGLSNYPSYDYNRQDAVIDLEGKIARMYIGHSLIETINIQDVSDYFIIGENRVDPELPCVLSFNFVNNTKARNNPFKQLSSNNVSPTKGFTDSLDCIQPLFTGAKGGMIDVKSRIPEKLSTLDRLIKSIPKEWAKFDSYDSLVNQYSRGAENAYQPASTLYSVVYLLRVITYSASVDRNEYLTGDSSLVDLVWNARCKCLTNWKNKGEDRREKCENWNWNFYRNDAQKDLDDSQDNLQGLYKEAWLSDICIYLYARLFGSDATKKSALQWAKSALPKAWTPIQVWTMAQIITKKSIMASYMDLTALKGVMLELAEELQTIYGFLVKALEFRPYEYSDISLTINEPTSSRRDEYPTVIASGIRNFSLENNPPAFLACFHEKKGVSFSQFANEFNTELILDMLLTMSSDEKNLTKLMQDKNNVKSILNILVNKGTDSYIYLFPIDVHTFEIVKLTVTLSQSIQVNMDTLKEVMESQGYQNPTEASNKFEVALGMSTKERPSPQRYFNIASTKKRNK